MGHFQIDLVSFDPAAESMSGSPEGDYTPSSDLTHYIGKMGQGLCHAAHGPSAGPS